MRLQSPAQVANSPHPALSAARYLLHTANDHTGGAAKSLIGSAGPSRGPRWVQAGPPRGPRGGLAGPPRCLMGPPRGPRGAPAGPPRGPLGTPAGTGSRFCPKTPQATLSAHFPCVPTASGTRGRASRSCSGCMVTRCGKAESGVTHRPGSFEPLARHPPTFFRHFPLLWEAESHL